MVWQLNHTQFMLQQHGVVFQIKSLLSFRLAYIEPIVMLLPFPFLNVAHLGLGGMCPSHLKVTFKDEEVPYSKITFTCIDFSYYPTIVVLFQHIGDNHDYNITKPQNNHYV